MCAFLQVILRTAAQRRLIQAQHSPTDSVAIAAVARRAVVALQCVAAHQIKKIGMLLLDRAHHFKLLRRSESSQFAAEALAADCFSILQAVAIGFLMTAEVTRLPRLPLRRIAAA